MLCSTVISHFSRVQFFATPWTAAHQAALSMGFSRQEYRNGLLCPPPGDLPDLGIEPSSLTFSCIGRQVLYHYCHPALNIKLSMGGTCPEAQWLRCYTSNAVDTGSIPSRGVKIPHAVPCGQKTKSQSINGHHYLIESTKSPSFRGFI